MLKIYRIYAHRMINVESFEKVLVLLPKNENRNKKLELYLKMMDLEKNVIYIQQLDLNKVSAYNAKQIIVLTVNYLARDIEELSVLIDVLVQKNISIVSVLDQLMIDSSNRKLFFFEKKLFLNAYIENSINGNMGVYVSELKKDAVDEGKNIAVYCRVSTREQAVHGYSIENQKEKIEAYINLYEYKVKNLYYFIDEGASASSLKRKQMTNLLTKVMEREIDDVIIYKLDRLTRNVIDVYDLISLFLDNDVNLVAVMDQIDIKTANGRLLVGMLAIFAQWERETNLERTIDGQRRMAFEGRYPTPKTPLGYKKDENKYLFVDEDTVDIINKIFYLAAGGATYVEIKKHILDEYNFKINEDRIKRIVFNPGYYGEFVYRGEVFKNVMPAIITKKEALQAQKMLGNKSVLYGQEQNEFHYRKKIICNCCGETTICIPTYKKNKRYYYYFCKKCNERINQDKVDKMVLSEILIRLKNIDIDKHMEEINMKIEKYKKKMSKIINNFVAEMISYEVYVETLSTIEKNIKKEQARLAREDILNGRSWINLNKEERRKIIEETIHFIKVDLSKEHVVEIEYVENVTKQK